MGSIRSSLRDCLSTPYRLTKEQCWTVTVLHHILIHIGDLHLVLPALKLICLSLILAF